jgi:hypothetical protein
VLGLVPGRPTTVPLVVVAEDGVTSLRYYVVISRAPAPARPPGAAPAPAPGWPGLSAYTSAGLGADPGALAGAPDAGAPAAGGVAGGWPGARGDADGAAAGANGTAAAAGGLQYAGAGARAAAAEGEAAAALAAAAAAAPEALPQGARTAAARSGGAVQVWRRAAGGRRMCREGFGERVRVHMCLANK